MEFRTIVDVAKPPFQIQPLETMLFVGSCFADHIGRRFREECFDATVNPWGVMYNPASVLHSVERFVRENAATLLHTVFITLGTNHVYILNATGEIVDNCQKRPQRLFTEQELSVGQCAHYLHAAIQCLRAVWPDVRIVMTVSPIRYRKYGYHGSQLSKATLLLAVDEVLRSGVDNVAYFPAYEIVNDELRDYRFYADDMLHPSNQAVGYIWERLVESYFADTARAFLREWQPVKAALAHRPFHPDSDDYKAFLRQAQKKKEELLRKYQKTS